MIPTGCGIVISVQGTKVRIVPLFSRVAFYILLFYAHTVYIERYMLWFGLQVQTNK